MVNPKKWTIFLSLVFAMALFCTAQTYVVYEDFAGGSADFPPAGWAINDNGEPGTWVNSEETDNTYNGITSLCAVADSDWDQYSTFNTELWTPVMDCSALTNVMMEFDYDFQYIYGDETGRVDISNDNGATWTNLATYTDDIYGHEEMDITSYAAGYSQVYVRFVYDSNDNDYLWWFAIDNVEIYTMEATIYLNPPEQSGGCCVGDSFNKTVCVMNYTDTALDVTMSYCGSAGFTVAFSPNPVNVPSGDTVNVTATVMIDSSVPGGTVDDITIMADAAPDHHAECIISATAYDDFVVQDVATLNYPRLDGGVVNYMDHLYVFGGYDTLGAGNVVQTEEYDPIADTWTDIGDMTAPLADYPATAAICGDQVLIPSGTGSVWKLYDIGDDTWTDITPPAIYGNGIFGGKIVACGGNFYVVGGADISGSSYVVFTETYAFDPNTMAWTQLADAPADRWWHVAFVYNNKIYVMGGQDANSVLQSTGMVYDIGSDTWSTSGFADAPGALWGCCGVLAGNFFYMFGGNNGTTAQDAIHVYDCVMDSWETATQTIPHATFRFGGAAIGNTAYGVGGFDPTYSFAGLEWTQKIQSCVATDGPDAAIFASGIWALPENPAPGDLVTIHANILSIGTEGIDSANVEFYIDDVLLDTVALGSLGVGGATELTVDWDTTGLDPTNYTVRVTIVDVMPTDINYGNNTASLDVALPVELSYFTATGFGNLVNVKWETQTEVDNLGFNLYRVQGVKTSPFITTTPVKLNDALIPGQGTSHTPHTYQFIDHVKNGGNYIYILESVSVQGETETWRTRITWPSNKGETKANRNLAPDLKFYPF